MRRKKQKLRKKTAPRSPRSWFLLVIDNEPIRRRALHEYQKIEKNVIRLRGDIEVFETRDRPEFHRWEATVFGPLLSEIREIESALAKKQHLLQAVEEEAFFSNCSRKAAYRTIMARLTNPAQFEGEDAEPSGGEDAADDEGRGEKMFGASNLPPDFDFQEYDRLSAAGKRSFRASYEEIAMLFEAMTGNPAPDLDEVLARERPGGPRPEPPPRKGPAKFAPPPRPEDERIKVLYRQLARQLHPDTNPNHGWRERELWHEVQSAYQSRDLERLEAVAARIEMGLHGASTTLPVHMLHRLARDLHSALQGLKKQIRQARNQTAWNFSARTEDLPGLEKQRRQGLEADRKRAGAELARLTAALDALATKVDSPKKSRPPRPIPQDDPRQMDFF